MKRTKFSFRQWRWTGPSENLFSLGRTELAIFAQLCREANTVA